MVIQILIGSGLILISILLGAACWLAFETALTRLHGWLMRPPFRIKLVTALAIAICGTLVMISASIWIWTFAFVILGIFETTEAALYFSMVSLTTLGFGDVLLPPEWRLLGGMIATNGFLSFGLVTALLVETMRSIRLGQGSTK